MRYRVFLDILSCVHTLLSKSHVMYDHGLATHEPLEFADLACLLFVLAMLNENRKTYSYLTTLTTPTLSCMSSQVAHGARIGLKNAQNVKAGENPQFPSDAAARLKQAEQKFIQGRPVPCSEALR